MAASSGPSSLRTMRDINQGAIIISSSKDVIKRNSLKKGYLTNEEANGKEALLINQEKKRQSFEIQRKTRKNQI